MTEDFEKWFKDNNIDGEIMYGQSDTSRKHGWGTRGLVERTWEARQPEIDSLNERLGLCELALDNRNENVSNLMEVNAALKAELDRLKAEANDADLERQRYLSEVYR